MSAVFQNCISELDKPNGAFIFLNIVLYLSAPRAGNRKGCTGIIQKLLKKTLIAFIFFVALLGTLSAEPPKPKFP